jgi:hypothetical protein
VSSVRSVAALIAVAVAVSWSGGARAYRPFDGTDAAVAETGEMEIELGPVEYLRDGADRTLPAPNVRINHGFTPGWEASLEGEVAHGLTAGSPRTSLVESEALLKGVRDRRGYQGSLRYSAADQVSEGAPSRGGRRPIGTVKSAQ